MAIGPNGRARRASRAASSIPNSGRTDLEFAGKRIVVIGSGATAVTLVPALAETAAHVTMLQRSPSWIVARPSEDGIARWLQRRLPARMAARTIRLKNVLLGMLFFQRSRKRPEKVRALLLKWVEEQLPGRDIDEGFRADLQSLGPARLSRARRRPVPGDPRGAGLGGDGYDRALHGDRDQTGVRARPSMRTLSSRRPVSS